LRIRSALRAELSSKSKWFALSSATFYRGKISQPKAFYCGAGDFHGVAHGRGPSYWECGFEAGIVIRYLHPVSRLIPTDKKITTKPSRCAFICDASLFGVILSKSLKPDR